MRADAWPYPTAGSCICLALKLPRGIRKGLRLRGGLLTQCEPALPSVSDLPKINRVTRGEPLLLVDMASVGFPWFPWEEGEKGHRSEIRTDKLTQPVKGARCPPQGPELDPGVPHDGRELTPTSYPSLGFHACCNVSVPARTHK